MYAPDPTRPLQDCGIIEITEMFDADPTNPELVKEIREELAYRRGNLPKVRELAKRIPKGRTKVRASNRERVATFGYIRPGNGDGRAIPVTIDDPHDFGIEIPGPTITLFNEVE